MIGDGRWGRGKEVVWLLNAGRAGFKRGAGFWGGEDGRELTSGMCWWVVQGWKARAKRRSSASGAWWTEVREDEGERGGW